MHEPAVPVLQYASGAAANDRRASRLIPALCAGSLAGSVSFVLLVLMLRGSLHDSAIRPLPLLLYVAILMVFAMALCSAGLSLNLAIRQSRQEMLFCHGALVCGACGYACTFLTGFVWDAPAFTFWTWAISLLLCSSAVAFILAPRCRKRTMSHGTAGWGRALIVSAAVVGMLLATGLASDLTTRNGCKKEVAFETALRFPSNPVEMQTRLEAPFLVAVRFDALDAEGYTIHYLCFFGWRVVIWNELRWIS